MATKYFCDICKKEVDLEEKVNLWGRKIIFESVCLDCWSGADKALQTRKDDLKAPHFSAE